jgi:hypothetical protein
MKRELMTRSADLMKRQWAMRKRNIVALLAVLVLNMALPCGISYASGAAPDNYATNQLQVYIGGYKTEYQNFGFASPGDMENSRLGTPVHLYRFDQTGIENYTNGDLPLVDNQEWLYPIYGENNQIENAIRISTGSDGKPNSIFGGFDAAFLNAFYQENDDLAKQADGNSLKVILEENLSTLFFSYKQNGKSLTIPFIFVPNRSYGLQNRTAYDTDSVGQALNAIQVKSETDLKNARIKFPNELLVGGGGIGVSSAPNRHQETLFSLWVLMALGIAAGATYLIRRKRLPVKKGL